MNCFKKALLITLLSTTSIYQVHAQSASVFNAMYYKARQGDLPGLVNMVSGGVNVDTLNSNGDTGLCLAAKSRDMRAYNTFLSAGADPAHSCTTEIPGYTTFAKRSGYQTYEYTAPERSVYGGSDGSGAIYGKTKHASAVYTGSENSSHTIAPGWYWAGGIVLAGAGVALALGGGGGGGGGSGDSDPGLTCVNGCAVYDTKGRCTVCRDHLFVQSVDAESLENDQALESAPAVEGWLPWGGVHTLGKTLVNRGNIALYGGEKGVGILSCYHKNIDTCLTEAIEKTSADINNSGSITAENTSRSIGIASTTLGALDGIYLQAGNLINSGDISMSGQNNTGVVLLGNGHIKQSGQINLSGTASSDTAGYENTGLYYQAKGSNLWAYEGQDKIENSGAITLDLKSPNKSTAAGIKIVNESKNQVILENSAPINVKNTNGKAYGIYAQNADVTNKGSIIVSADKGTAIGVDLKNVTYTGNGNITVTGGSSTAVKAQDSTVSVGGKVVADTAFDLTNTDLTLSSGADVKGSVIATGGTIKSAGIVTAETAFNLTDVKKAEITAGVVNGEILAKGSTINFSTIIDAGEGNSAFDLSNSTLNITGGTVVGDIVADAGSHVTNLTTLSNSTLDIAGSFKTSGDGHLNSVTLTGGGTFEADSVKLQNVTLDNGVLTVKDLVTNTATNNKYIDITGGTLNLEGTYNNQHNGAIYVNGGMVYNNANTLTNQEGPSFVINSGTVYQNGEITVEEDSYNDYVFILNGEDAVLHNRASKIDIGDDNGVIFSVNSAGIIYNEADIDTPHIALLNGGTFYNGNASGTQPTLKGSIYASMLRINETAKLVNYGTLDTGKVEFKSSNTSENYGTFQNMELDIQAGSIINKTTGKISNSQIKLTQQGDLNNIGQITIDNLINTGSDIGAISISDQASFTNNGTISVSKIADDILRNIAIGQYGGTFINEQEGILDLNSNVKMLINSGTFQNDGTINLSDFTESVSAINIGMGTGENPTLINNGTIKAINNVNSVLELKKGVVINSGTIQFTGSIKIDSGEFNNLAGSKISFGGEESHFYLEGGTLENAGTIEWNYQKDGHDQGVASFEIKGGTFINTGTVKSTEADLTMKGGSFTNRGTVEIKRNEVSKIGSIWNMLSGEVINYGTINVSGDSRLILGQDPSIRPPIGQTLSTLTFVNAKDALIDISGKLVVNTEIINKGRIYANQCQNTGEDTGIHISMHPAHIENEDKITNQDGGVIDHWTMEVAGGGTTLETPASASKSTLVLGTNARIYNSGVIESEGEVDLGDNSQVVMLSGGVMKAASFKGSASVGADTTTGSNADEYVEEAAFVGENAGLEARSASAMFEASVVDKGESTDIVMRRTRFEELLGTDALSGYLEKNYTEGNRVDLYDSLKEAQSVTELSNKIKNKLGQDMVPDLAYQNIRRSKSMTRTMESMAGEETEEFERVVVEASGGYEEHEALGGVLGYEDHLYGVSGLFDRMIGDQSRFGIGVSALSAKADFDGSDSRRDGIITVYAPYQYESEDFGLMSMPYAGYSHGEYKRYDEGKMYKSDTDVYYYGFNNKVYGKVDAYGLKVEPTMELNINGAYMEGLNEKKGLHLQGENNLSIEAGAGVYASREEDVGEGRLKIKGGTMVYQELNKNVYQDQKARMYGLEGRYRIRGYDNRETRGVLSLKGSYEIKGWNIYGELLKLIEHDDNTALNVGVKYSF